MASGVVVYKHGDTTELKGKWFYRTDDSDVISGTEIATLTTGDPLNGMYDVKIYDDGESLIFVGTLSIVPSGSAFLMKWEGKSSSESSTSTYVGVGMLTDDDSLSATYELLADKQILKTPRRIGKS